MSRMAETGRTRLRYSTLALVLAGATTFATLPAAAQATGPGRKPGQADATSDPACASYGAGFTRLAGSSTCVKISGGVQVDVYSTDVNSSSRVNALSPGLQSK
ncbi:hypothetical protein [Ancylobacter sp.]|uniref:hypothetical protein n=1 Tax=Ancylobacter sp. TaxID=1872567 RepID=UPI003D11F864